jgi:hypothetical protein
MQGNTMHWVSGKGRWYSSIGLALLIAASVSPVTPSGQSTLTDPIVFVSRQIPEDGSDFLPGMTEDRAMPGVGGRERFRIAAPGRLLVRESDGTLRTLVDGAAPTQASRHLIDVSAPAVSYDGTSIAFAGLPAPPAGQVDSTGSHAEPGRWRIFTIDADGTNLRQITFDDPVLDSIDMAQYLRLGERYRYDDTDPAWLPDGRIVFSSTRFLNVAEYGRARGTNLHVVNADGTGGHRITSERNGADRPAVDPVTGKIVYARWWLNGRFPSDRLDTIGNPDRGGLPSNVLLNGLTQSPSLASGGPGAIQANEWVAASVNPDGTDLALWSGSLRIPHFMNHYYGGTFTDAGVLYGNFFPDFPLTESGGFGGIRRYERGATESTPIWGLMRKTDDLIQMADPPSLTIIHSPRGYAADPVPLPDGRLLFSWARDPRTGAEDIGQDYGLFILDPRNPGSPTLVHDTRGTTELRAQLLRARPRPPIIADEAPPEATESPLRSDADIHRDGTFVFDALNVYFNGPVDMPIVSAPPIGSASTIRFFADYQRAPLNADTTLNFPVLLQELPVHANGAVRNPNAPANVPLFEDLRTIAGLVPLTSHDVNPSGGGFVTGMNFGRPGTTARCVGCHAGHTQISIPSTVEGARWTNLAPGAQVRVSSTSGNNPARLVNRQARIEAAFDHWKSHPGLAANAQWVQLEFPVPIAVRTVRLYAARDGVVVQGATVRLYGDDTKVAILAERPSAPVIEQGTDVAFGDIVARVIRIDLTDVRGDHASLAEIEVIGAGVDGGIQPPPPPIDDTPPSTPTNLTARTSASGKPVLTWSAATDDSGIEVSYVVRRSGAPDVEVHALTYTDGNVVAGTTYAYTVLARDAAGNESPPSEPVSVTVAAVVVPPTAPTNLRVTLDRQRRPVLAWSASTSPVGIRRYHVIRNALAVSRVTALSFTDRSTRTGRSYQYQIKAEDRQGLVSTLSNTVMVTVPASSR